MPKRGAQPLFAAPALGGEGEVGDDGEVVGGVFVAELAVVDEIVEDSDAVRKEDVVDDVVAWAVDPVAVPRDSGAGMLSGRKGGSVVQAAGGEAVSLAVGVGVEIAGEDQRQSGAVLRCVRDGHFDAFDPGKLAHMVEMRVVVAEVAACGLVAEEAPGRDSRAACSPGFGSGNVWRLRKREGAALHALEPSGIVENRAGLALVGEVVAASADEGIIGAGCHVPYLGHEALLGAEDVEPLARKQSAYARQTACPVIRRLVAWTPQIVGREPDRHVIAFFGDSLHSVFPSSFATFAQLSVKTRQIFTVPVGTTMVGDFQARRCGGIRHSTGRIVASQRR